MKDAPVATGTPTCPTWLSKHAKKVWRQIVPELSRMGILSQIDGNALSRYVHLVSVWRECVDFTEKNGHFYIRGEGGEAIRRAHPEAKMAMELARDLSKIESCFGMDPSARSRVKLPDAAAKHEAEKAAKKAKFFSEAV